MGIKGRRVHMIEELSETIISFQRGKTSLQLSLPRICRSTEMTNRVTLVASLFPICHELTLPTFPQSFAIDQHQ